MYGKCPNCGSPFNSMDFGGMDSEWCAITCQDCGHTLHGRDAEKLQERWEKAGGGYDWNQWESHP